MKLEDVKKVVVVGAGNMGHQIATLCAIQGFKVACSDVKPEILEKAEAFARKYPPPAKDSRILRNRIRPQHF